MAEPTEINPYPGPDNAKWTASLAEALADYTGWPLGVAEDVAVFIVRPKDYIVRDRATGKSALRPGTVVVRQFGSSTKHYILSAHVHGFMGSFTEYNERVRSAFAAPAAPGSSGLQLPALVTHKTEDGQPVALLESRDVLREEAARGLLEHAAVAMKKANGKRTWDLEGELTHNGQEEPSMHAIVRRSFEDDDGQVWTATDPMAIIGNNRSQARQRCLGIQGMTQFGHTPSVDGWNPTAADVGTEYLRPADWVPRQARVLQAAWEEPKPGEENPDRLRAHQVAREAGRLATVPAQFILRVEDEDGDPVETFERVVWEPNRTSHRRQPLDYDPHERATAEVRAVVAAYVDAQGLGADEADWLSGDAAAPASVSSGTHVRTNADLRDERDVRLWRLMFPDNGPDRELVRTTLGEPPAKRTLAEHVRQRLRLTTAAIATGYAGDDPWSERVNDGLLRSRAIADAWHCSGRSASTLLVTALKGGPKATPALEEFIVTRGVNWLAHADLVVADRGSIGMGAKTKGLQRRNASSVRTALLKDQQRALGLFKELRNASGKVGSPARPVREVDEEGKPVAGTVATPQWFQSAFPGGLGSKKGPTPGPSRKRKPSKTELLFEARGQMVEHVFDVLAPAIVDTVEAAHKVAQAARAVGEPGFEADGSGTLDRLRDALTDIGKDGRDLVGVLADLDDPSPEVRMVPRSAALTAEDDDDQDDDQDDDDQDDEVAE